jgi:hypothetical protein
MHECDPQMYFLRLMRCSKEDCVPLARHHARQVRICAPQLFDSPQHLVVVIRFEHLVIVNKREQVHRVSDSMIRGPKLLVLRMRQFAKVLMIYG